MAPSATGSVVEHLRKDGLTSYWLRFRAYGERHRIVLGTDEDGWTKKRAEAELRNVLARVDAGIWRPPEKLPEAKESPLAPRFHAFASDWFNARVPELAPKTQIDYRWRLTNHLLPYFTPGASMRSTLIWSTSSGRSSSRRPRMSGKR